MTTAFLGDFTRSGLERYLGRDLSAGVQKAVAHYAAKLRAGRGLVPVPAFLPAPNRSSGVRVELALDKEDQSVLDRQARRLGVSMAQLVTHAVLVYLAELELLGAIPADARGCDQRPCR